MARVAVLEPEDDPRIRPALVPSTPDREVVLADRAGRRLEVRRLDGLLVARVTHGTPRLARVLAWMRDRLPD